MSKNIQRWAIRQRDDHCDYMATNDAGDWVKYEDYTRERDALQATVDAKWSYRLTTPPPPDPPGISYPNLSETYTLEVIDTGHSERILLLESKELNERIKKLEATVEKCRAAGFIDEKGEVRKVLGTLPLTADGCVFGAGYPTCWIPSLAVGAVRAHTTTNGEDGGHEPSEVYSTRQAAERAKGVE